MFDLYKLLHSLIFFPFDPILRFIHISPIRLHFIRLANKSKPLSVYFWYDLNENHVDWRLRNRKSDLVL